MNFKGKFLRGTQERKAREKEMENRVLDIKAAMICAHLKRGREKRNAEEAGIYTESNKEKA